MAYKGGVRASSTIRDRRIPLWLTVHEAGHLIARIQLVTAWNLSGLDNPSSFESIRVWIDERGKPRGTLPMRLQRPTLISVSKPSSRRQAR
jgi:hypothetical protein